MMEVDLKTPPESYNGKFKKDQPDPSNPPDQIPACPQCAKPMVLRTAKTGRNAGQQFWGCTAYPDCKGVVKV